MPEQTDLPIDLTLTPENAQERGYMHLYDIFDGMMRDPLVKSMVDDGYKLGRASNKSYVLSAGVYQPVKKQTAQE